MWRREAIAGGLAVLALACSKKQEEAATPGAAEGGPTPSAQTVSGGATLTGEVKFVGTAPANPVIDMADEPSCKADYTTPPHQEIVVVNPNGTLGNVFVYVKSGLPPAASYAAAAAPVVIDQHGCLYHPRVFGIMVGQPLAIKNSDPLLHNIKAMGKANRPFNISQPAAGMTTQRTFNAPEVMLPLECNVHGWMRAYVGVLPSPYFATTGADGTFTIQGLPPGTYTIEAWHEKYGTKTATVTISGTETKTLEFTYGGAGR